MARIEEKEFVPVVRTALRFRTEEIDRIDESDVFKRSHRLTKNGDCAFSPRIDFCSKDRAAIGSDTNCLHDTGRRVPREFGQRGNDQDTPDTRTFRIRKCGGKTRGQYFIRVFLGLIDQKKRTMERIRLRQPEIKIPPYCNDRKFCPLKCIWIKRIAPSGRPSAPIFHRCLERRTSDFEY